MKFQNTEEAVAYGKKATARQINRLRRARADFLTQCKVIALASPRGHVLGLDRRMELVTYAQFCREAIEAGGERI